MIRSIISYSRGRVTDSLFEANQLEQNDAKRTGGGEICVSFASGSTVLRNVIQPNEQNEILMVDQAGGLKNQFDYQVYYPNGKQSTATDLIFYWGDTECDGLKAFQETSKQEIHATVAKATK
jgi:hypothetical protein